MQLGYQALGRALRGLRRLGQAANGMGDRMLVSHCHGESRSLSVMNLGSREIRYPSARLSLWHAAVLIGCYCKDCREAEVL